MEARFNFESIVQRRIEQQRRDVDEAKASNEAFVRRDRANEIRATRRELAGGKRSQRRINVEARKRSKKFIGVEMPFLRALRDEAERGLSEVERRHGRFTMPRDEARAWAVELTWMMSRVEAQAACLVVGMFYDENPAPHPALPPALRVIPWGDPDEPHNDDDVLRGRWIVGFMQGFDPRLVYVGHQAIARLNAYPEGEVTVAPLAEHPVTVSAGKRKRVAKKASEHALTETEIVFIKILIEQPPELCLQSPRLCTLFAAREHRLLTPCENDFRSRIVPRLEKWGLVREGRRGYRLPADARARKVFSAGG